MTQFSRLIAISALGVALVYGGTSATSLASAHGALVARTSHQASAQPAGRADPVCSGLPPSQSNDAVLAADPVTSEIGWVLTGNSLLRTTDGGRTWSPVTPPAAHADMDGARLAARSIDQAWLACAGPGRSVIVSYTANRGRTWHKAILPPPEGTKVQFLADAPHVYPLALTISPGGGVYLLTSPGAAAYQQPVVLYRAAPDSTLWRQIAVSNPGTGDLPTYWDKTGLAVTASAGVSLTASGPGRGTYVYHSMDAGATWHFVAAPLPSGYDSLGGAVAYAPAFYGADGVLPVVLDGQRLRVVIERTTDGGQSWRLGAVVPEPQLMPPAVSFVSPRVGYLVGIDGLLVTQDSGVHWTAVQGRLPAGVTALSFVNRQYAWAVAASKLWATTTGGKTWHRLAEPTMSPRPLQRARRSPAHRYSGPLPRGYVVDQTYWLNGSDAWAMLGPRGGASCCWYSGVLMRTEDGGKSWTQVASTDNPRPSLPMNGAVAFATPSFGVLKAFSNYADRPPKVNIYWTDDGGRTWERCLTAFPSNWAMIYGPPYVKQGDVFIDGVREGPKCESLTLKVTSGVLAPASTARPDPRCSLVTLGKPSAGPEAPGLP